MDSNTARSVLDLPRNGSLEEDDIQEAFREKSKEYHPDTSDLSNAREKFLEVKKAREVLLAAGTTQSSQSSSSTTQSSTSQSSNPNRNSADKQSSTSDPGSRSRTGNRTRTSQSGWQKETSSWASDGNTGGDWRADKASSSTREKESRGSSETHQRNQSSSKTETESEGESTGGRTKIHQQAWEENFTWDPHYGFSRGGYLGVDEFPQRPPSRSRIFHFLAIIIGCIATALLSRGQYNALKDSTAASRVIEPFLSLQLTFTTPTMLIIAGTFRKVKILWRFLRLPRVYLPIIGGGAAPVIIQSVEANLSVHTATLAALAGSGLLMSGLVLIRHSSEDQNIPTIDEWLNVKPGLTWLPGGIFPLLALHTPVYITSQSFHLLYYESFKYYFLLIGPSLLLAYGVSRTRLMSREEIAPGTVLVSMMIIGLVIHLPWFEPIMPGYLLSGTNYYAASSGVRFLGILLTILAISWHFLFAAIVEVLLMGWDIGWHKLPSKQPVPYTVWSGLIGAGIGVIIWAVWPTYQAPVAYPAAHQYLIVGVGVFAYVYGITTDPITD